MSYNNFIPAPNCWSGCPNPQAIYNTYGTPCPPSHPNTQPPNCPPPVPNQQPGITPAFMNNISSGFNKFGCSFLYNRHAVQLQKLAQLQQAGTNPNWQQMLTNRINYLNNLINSNCTGGPTPPPPKPQPTPHPGGQAVNNTQQMMNASGDLGTQGEVERAIRVSQVVGLWFN
jgi:hypothetical protein